MCYGLSCSQLVSGRVALENLFKDFNYFRAIFFLVMKFRHKSLKFWPSTIRIFVDLFAINTKICFKTFRAHLITYCYCY